MCDNSVIHVSQLPENPTGCLPMYCANNDKLIHYDALLSNGRFERVCEDARRCVAPTFHCLCSETIIQNSLVFSLAGKIMHRDISSNNILIKECSAGAVTILLNDFDTVRTIGATSQ
jgi:hypothetical protein